MAKRDDLPHRLNLVIPLELLDELRTIAKTRFGAKNNHLTGHPEVSQTLIKLIRIGIDAVASEDMYLQDEDSRPQSLKDKYEGLEFRFGSLANELDRLRERVNDLEQSTHKPLHTPIHTQNDDLIHTPIQVHNSIDDELFNQDESTHTPTHTGNRIDEDELNPNEDELDPTHTPTHIGSRIDEGKELPKKIDEDDLITSKGGKPPAVSSKRLVQAIRDFRKANKVQPTLQQFSAAMPHMPKPLTNFTLNQIMGKKSPYDFD